MRALFLLSLTLSLLSLHAHAAPTATWRVNFDSTEHTLNVYEKNQKATVQVPSGVTQVGSDDNTLYLWNPSKKEVTLASKFEIFGMGAARTQMSPNATISFANELSNFNAATMAVFQNNESSTVIFAEPSKAGRTRIFPFTFLKRRNVSESDLQKADIRSDAPNVDADREGLIALKGSAQEILGGISIAMMRDPETGGVLLLSYDPQAMLIHEYGVSNAFAPLYLKSYALPEALQKEKDRLAQFSLDTNNTPDGYLFLRHPQYENVRLSLLKMREAYSISRTHLLTNWNREVIGNTWTKQLLGWGALSSLVDKLDSLYLNPNVNVENLANDINVKTIVGQNNREEVLKFAKESGLFTDKEIDLMRTEGNLKEFKGRKAMFTAGLVIGVLGYINVKDSGVLKNQITHITSNLWGFAETILRRMGRSEQQLQAFREWGKRKQIRFRARLVESAEIQRHPSHLIKSLEKQLVKAEKAAGVSLPKIDPSKAPSQQVAELMTRWKVLFESGASEAGQAAKVATKEIEKVQEELKKLSVLEDQIKITDRLSKIKTQILLTKSDAAAITAGKPKPNIRELTKADENMGFLKATNPELLQKNAKEAIAALDVIEAELVRLAKANPKDARLAAQAKEFSEKIKPARIARFTKDLDAAIAERVRINEIVDSWVTKGKVHPFFDYWARVSAAWGHYFMPQKMMQKVGLESDFAKNWARPDYMRTGNGYEKVVVSGENARLAITTGVFDVTGDVVTQWLGRLDATDPNERIWGAGDNFLGLVSYDGKKYGPHFDLIASEMVNAWGWSVSMPMSYARQGMGYGSKGSISQLRRIWDAQVKSVLPHNFFWGMANEYPFWFISSKVISWDYERKHTAAGDFKQEKFDEFLRKLNSRTTSWSSRFERIFFGKGVGIPYINPQYMIQDDFNKAADLIFRNTWASRIVAGVVMPITTGYGYAKWSADYFGFNNPTTIEVMKKLEIDGILKKIDNDGYTNVNEWTFHEKNMFFYMVMLFEMERFAKEKPLPIGGRPEELAAWYNEVYVRLFGTANPDLNKLGEATSRLKVMATGSRDKVTADKDTRYAAQAKTFLAMMNNMQTGIARLPYVESGRNNGVMAVKMEAANEGVNAASLDQLQNLLQDAAQINASIADTLRVMQDNRKGFLNLQSNASTLSLANLIALGDQFFAQGRLVGLPLKLVSQWSATSQRIVSRLAVGATVSSIPFYFWLDDQAEAHLRSATQNGQLLAELQSLLLSATEALTTQYAMLSNQLDNASGNLDAARADLRELRVRMEQNKTMLESYLVDTQAASQDLLESRGYRWAKVYSDFSLYGMGGMGAWMAGRYLLFRTSEGYFLRMTDAFAPTLFKASALAWFYFGHEYSAQQQRIVLTTQDFFVLHQSYVSTLIRIEMLKRAELAASRKELLSIDTLNAELPKLLEANNVYKKASDYRQRIVALTAKTEDDTSIGENMRKLYDKFFSSEKK
jgi:hypothetical protein